MCVCVARSMHRLLKFYAVYLAASLAWEAAAGSLRFFGTGAGDVDRGKIRIDSPPSAADVGATDFTIDFWLRASPGENAGVVSCGVNDGWITGNVVLDRDIYGPGPDWGIAIGQRPGGGMRVAFGASDAAGSGTVVCGTSNVADGAWYHIAVQRRLADGRIWLFVDGRLEASVLGPTGSLAYPDGRWTSWPASDPYLVLAAEKHDAGSSYPSFSGWLSELRLSTVLRYPTATTLGPAFTAHDRRHPVDVHTAALYRFQEGGGTALRSATGEAAVTGDVRVHPTLPRPQWSSEAPLPRSPGCLDLDDDGAVDPNTDGLLLMRAWLGLRGPALTAGALGSAARRSDPAAIVAYLAAQPLDRTTMPGREASRAGIALIRLMAGVGDTELLIGLGSSAAPAAVRSEVAAGCGLP